jgi:pyruvate dehydrogenase E2 component (dihydrolipoamide acetyltransferase)
MSIRVEMPRLSDTMQQGTIVKWNVKEGQVIKTGQAIADIETDKATMELQSFDDGVVAAILVPEGKAVPVTTPMLLLAVKGEDPIVIKAQFVGGGTVAAAAPAAKAVAAGGGTPLAGGSSAATAVIDAPASSNGSRLFVSPLARKIAEEAHIDLHGITGSGPGGRIVRKDVEEAIARGGSGGVAPGRAAQSMVPAAPAPRAAASTPPSLPAANATLATRRIPLSNMRRVIAQRLVESKTTIPHYQVTTDVDMEPLDTLRKQLNAQLATQGVKLSVNDFLVKACALAMHQHPYVNSRWSGTPGQEAIEYVADVNIGVAIALPVADDGTGGGLVVATLRNADSMGLRALSTQTKALSDKARSKGLSPAEMSDSTFTISNLGMFGVSHFTAIINPPNTAILAVGAALDVPVVRDGKVVPGKVMSMTMSSDHRVIDGAMAAQYLATVKNLLENPATLLV